MKPIIPTFAALGASLGAALTLGACADYGYGGGPRYAGGYGGGFDAYYDDFYGPYYGGYWGSDGVFMFSRTRGGRMERDDDHHFRRDGVGLSGFHGVHSDRAMARSATDRNASRPASATEHSWRHR